MQTPSEALKNAQADLEAAAKNHNAAVEQYTSLVTETMTAREALEEVRATLTLKGAPGSNAEQRAAFLNQGTKEEAETLRQLESRERLGKATLTNAETALMVARYRVRVWLALVDIFIIE
ncbi:MAG: hypothetical protein RLZZ156_1405 [Deinococcota bacterium]|jgi:hypothetical protein